METEYQRSVDRFLDVLKRNNKYVIERQKFRRGLCWCSNMEEESTLQLNLDVFIRLKHPLLKQRVETLRKYARKLYRREITFKDFLAEVKQRITDEDCKPGFLKILEFANYDEELEAALQLMKSYNERASKAVSSGTSRQYSEENFVVTYFANRYVLLTTSIKDIPCTCKADEEISLVRILPCGANTEKVICYNSCQRTLFAAFKRQMMRVFKPSATQANRNDNGEFQEFVKDYFHKYVEPVLSTFDYSYSQWYNKMPAAKQQAMDQAKAQIEKKGYPEVVEYGLFCKREKQQAGGKNRAIANIDPQIKYIMGPVCWALEDLADKFFPGYCGKKSWEDLEDYLCANKAAGYDYVLQGDGSAFDTCQHYELKLIDRLIYNYLADHGKIWHVDSQAFKLLSTAELRELNAKTFEDKKFSSFASATIRGTVFSGASDTTLMNTIRMALYNMYTFYRKGLEYNVDYKLLAKGDDFMVFTRTPDLNGESYEDVYNEIWMPKPKHTKTCFSDVEGSNRLGMILKFLNVGGYHTIDFCSVTCIPYDDQTKFKLARKPNRMTPLAHYSRNALKMSQGQYKQYLLDQAMAIDLAMPDMPFYREYAEAYRYHANLIQAEPTRLQSGKAKKQLQDDGHKKVEEQHHEFFYESEFYDYGHDFVEGLKWRQSRHKIPEGEVLSHLLQHFNISYNDIQYHGEFLKKGGFYDAVADSTAL